MAIANFVVLLSIIGGAVMVGAIWEWFADCRLAANSCDSTPPRLGEVSQVPPRRLTGGTL